MSDSRFCRRLCAWTFGALLLSACGEHRGDRLEAGEVTLRNHEAYEVQLRADLPTGTPKADVARHLASQGVEYHFLDPAYSTKHDPLMGNAYVFRLRRIGTTILFETDLVCEVHFDPQDKSDNVRCTLDYPTAL